MKRSYCINLNSRKELNKVIDFIKNYDNNPFIIDFCELEEDEYDLEEDYEDYKKSCYENPQIIFGSYYEFDDLEEKLSSMNFSTIEDFFEN